MIVNFSEWVKFLGRNGYFKCTGVSLIRMHSKDPKYACETVRIYPTTSKGEDGRCFIEIPVENVPKFIEELQAILSEEKGERNGKDIKKEDD